MGPRHERSQTPRPTGRPNTLNLGESELSELMDRLDSGEKSKSSARRNFARWPFRRTTINLQVIQDGAPAGSMQVACRNLSRGGMSVVHSSFLHPGTRCIVDLPHPRQGHTRVTGSIVRCQHRSGMVHELGIRFDKGINLRDIVRADPFTGWFTLETVDAVQLRGRILYVDPSEIDRKVVQHFLRNTQLDLRVAPGLAEAVIEAESGVDLVIADAGVPDLSGRDVVTSLRGRGCEAPIILVSNDTSPESRARLESMAPNAMLSKPLSSANLVRAIAEFLMGAEKSKPAAGEDAAGNEGLRELARAFLDTLPPTTQRLSTAIAARDWAGCRLICLQLAGTAPAVGLKQVGDSAGVAARVLGETRSVAAADRELRAVTAACERASARAA